MQPIVGVLGAETRTFRSTSGTVTPAPGPNTNAVTDQANLSYGLGAQYDSARNVTLRVDKGPADRGWLEANDPSELIKLPEPSPSM